MVVYGCIIVLRPHSQERISKWRAGGLTNWLSSQRDRFDRYLMFETGTVGVCFF